MTAQENPKVLEGSGNTFHVAGDLTIATATRALAEARHIFTSPGEGTLLFDLGRLRECDSAALSVLLEWKRRAVRLGRDLTYCNVPDRLLQLAQIGELENLLGFEKAR